MKNLIIPISLLFYGVQTSAQEAINNNGNLQIHSGANVTGFGSFTNTFSGAFINNGTLYIKGNITNAQASMANSSGTLQLTGSGVQSINGTETFRTNNLITNNSAGITLNNNLSVAGAHTFISGIITTSSTPNYLAYEAGSSYSGSSDNRHVNGWVQKTGTTNFSFPTGNGTYLRSITVANLSVSSVFNAHYEGPTINTGNLDASLLSVDQYEYWSLNKISGGSAQVTLNWDNSKIPFPPYTLAGIRVAQYSAALWTDRGSGASGNVATTGTITSNTLNSFGSFTFGASNATLPLQYINLTAKRKDGYTLVKWKTEQEVNVDHFEIQRQNVLSGEFVKIGTMAARNTLTPNFYEYSDPQYSSSVAYYRIKSIDIDGQSFYSNIALVNSNESQSSYKVINPVTNNIYVQVDDSYAGSYQYEVLAISGQLVQSGSLHIESAGTVNIPLRHTVLKGHYILKIQNSVRQIVEQIITR